ncbi:MAG TPA: hypothetical protein VH252_06360 [Chthoniobacterales bacterium]|nr:hypothetical protein [Chthoniobacterales bacterium]
MIAASLFDHPALVLLIVFVAVVRWLLSKAKSQPQNPQNPPAPPSRPISRGGETQTEEERVRRFLEALGQPTGTTPPKVVPRRRAVQPKIFPNLPPLTTAPPPLPQTEDLTSALPPPLPAESPRRQPSRAVEPTFEVHDVARQTASDPASATGRAAAPRLDPRIKLGTPQDLRNAIILREIFGPPRSLQPFDLTN